MSICKIGEKKEIGGKWYQKTMPRKAGLCYGCAFYENKEVSGVCSGDYEVVTKSLESGGMECENSIWAACEAPKPTKKPAPAKWEPLDLREMWGIGPKTTRAQILDILLKTEETLNAYGRENARLKARLAKGGK